MLKGKSPEQIREMFGIENDFTPEEEEKIREENRVCSKYCFAMYIVTIVLTTSVCLLRLLSLSGVVVRGSVNKRFCTITVTNTVRVSFP